MKYKNLKLLLVLLVVFLTTGCTEFLKDEDNKQVTNEITGQQITKNIICQPTDKNNIKIYNEYDVNIEKLPECKDLNITSDEYESLWTSFFVQPLSFLLLKVGGIVSNYGLSIVLVALLIRLIMFPITQKTAMQSELIKKAKPELQKLEKTYENKKSQEDQMRKTQEMMAIYKKHKINPITGCLFALIQLPLFIGFYEAIQRTPAIYEDKLLGLQLGTAPSMGISSDTWFMYILIVVLVSASTFISLKLNSASTNSEINLKSLPLIMTIMITVFGIFMPSGLALYWITSNIFTLLQNLLVKRRKGNENV